MRKQKISQKEIIFLLQDFAKKAGRPPKRNDPEFESLVYAIEKEFGSWNYALRIAGIQTYNAWRKKRGIKGKIRSLLNYNPMTLVELKKELFKDQDSNTNLLKQSTSLGMTLQSCSDIKSIGPRKKKIYFIKGQESLAQTRLDQVFSSVNEQQEMLFYSLRKPMTKKEIRNLFPKNKNKCEIWLKELLYARLIYKAKFVARARGGVKYSATELFDKLACQIVFCRFDCPNEMADFINRHIPIEKLDDPGFRVSLTHRLKTILPLEIFKVWERESYGLRHSNTEHKPDSTESKLDQFFQ
jgi:hypothetical protein